MHGSIVAVASGDGERYPKVCSDEVRDRTSCGSQAWPSLEQAVRHPHNLHRSDTGLIPGLSLAASPYAMWAQWGSKGNTILW